MRRLPEGVGPPGLTVITRAELLSGGWSRSAVAYALRLGELTALDRGVYLVGDLVGEEGLVGARSKALCSAICASRRLSGAVISGQSAALLHGLPTLGLPQRPCVTVPPGQDGGTPRIHLHRTVLAPSTVLSRHGVLVTSPARTIVDIGREHGVQAAVVTADAALHARLTSIRRLQQVAGWSAGMPGMARVHRLIELVDPLAESPLESVSRLTLDARGLRARTQVDLVDEYGRHLGRVDFYWDEYGVAGEADGMVKYTNPSVLRAEKRRQERLENAGVVTVRWGQREVDQPDLLEERVRAAWARGAARVRPRRFRPR